MSAEREAQDMCDWLRRQGFNPVRQLPDGSFAGMQHMLTTTAIFLGLDMHHWEARYCFKSGALAALRFAELQSESDVPEGWFARRPEQPKDIEAKSRLGYLGGDPSLASSWAEKRNDRA